MSEKIDALLEERGKSWGSAAATHARIAQVWSGILDTEVTAGQVALCMTGLKLVRASVNPGDPDSFDDGHGYLAIAEDIYGHNNLPHKSKPGKTFPGPVCTCGLCTTGWSHFHGAGCTSMCECGLGS